MGRTQYPLWLSDPEMRNKDNTSIFGLPVLDLPSPMATPGCSSQAQYVMTYGDSCTCIQVPEKKNFYFIIYMVRQFNSRNNRSMSLGWWVRQTHVLKHVWTSSNLRLHEAQTKWVVHSRAAEEVVSVCGIWLVEKWVTRIWSSG